MSENPIMKLYYTDRLVLFFMCAGNEAIDIGLYLLHFTEGPICEFYKIFLILQRKHEGIFYFLMAGIGLYRLIVYLSAPIALVKAAISVLHGYVSCINLSIIDVKER